MKRMNVKRMVQVALLIAVEIVLSRFLSIATPIAKIGFAFLPLSLIAILYGPMYAAIGGALADFIGAILFPTAAFFPGFTLTAFLTGLVYGFFLYRHRASWLRISIAVAINQIILHLGLNTVWLWMITNKGYLAILPTRVMQCFVMIPIQIITIYIAANKLYLLKPFMDTPPEYEAHG